LKLIIIVTPVKSLRQKCKRLHAGKNNNTNKYFLEEENKLGKKTDLTKYSLASDRQKA